MQVAVIDPDDRNSCISNQGDGVKQGPVTTDGKKKLNIPDLLLAGKGHRISGKLNFTGQVPKERLNDKNPPIGCFQLVNQALDMADVFRVK